MSKRTLFIIIGLLIFLDLAAFFIYFVGSSNRDGKSPLDFSIGNEERVVQIADTIPSVINEDRFDTIVKMSSFVSQDKIMAVDQEKGMLSSIKLKFVWPKLINKSESLSDLDHALMKKLTGTSYSSVQECIDKLLLHPRFVRNSNRYTPLEYIDEIEGPHHSKDTYRVFPKVGTAYLLEMEVLIEHYDGLSSHREMKVVHYDRMHNKVLNMEDIFDLSHSEDILALVNQGIEHLKTIKKNKTIHEIKFMPQEFLLGSKSVIFYMGDGTIANDGTGLYEVYVSNESLKPYFTDYYNELLNNDTSFKDYDYIAW